MTMQIFSGTLVLLISQAALALDCTDAGKQYKDHHKALKHNIPLLEQLGIHLRQTEEALVSESVIVEAEIRANKKNVSTSIRSIRQGANTLSVLTKRLIQNLKNQSYFQEFNRALRQHIGTRRDLTLSGHLRMIISQYNTQLNAVLRQDLTLVADLVEESEGISQEWEAESQRLMDTILTDDKSAIETVIESALRDRKNLLESSDGLQILENKYGLELRETQKIQADLRLKIESLKKRIEDTGTAIAHSKNLTSSLERTVYSCTQEYKLSQRDRGLRH